MESDNKAKAKILQEWADPEPVRLYLWTALIALGIFYGLRVTSYHLLTLLLDLVFASLGIHTGNEDVFTLSQSIAFAISIVIAGIGILIYSLLVFPDKIKDKSDNGIALVATPFSSTVLAGLIGVLLFIILIKIFLSQPHIRCIGGLEEKGILLQSCILLGLLTTALVEEFLFRGILFGGFSRTLGREISAYLTTAIFVGLHLIDAWGINFYTIFPIIVISAATVGLRIWSGSIFPSMALHFAYNLAAASMVIWMSNKG